MKLDVNFKFELGNVERHEVSFYWGQFWGNARIEVDGVAIHKERHFFGFQKIRTYETTVGESEIHHVLIEKVMQPGAGGLRKQNFRAFVDQELIGEY